MPLVQRHLEVHTLAPSRPWWPIGNQMRSTGANSGESCCTMTMSTMQLKRSVPDSTCGAAPPVAHTVGLTVASRCGGCPSQVDKVLSNEGVRISPGRRRVAVQWAAYQERA
jgi:hypothetical protein